MPLPTHAQPQLRIDDIAFDVDKAVPLARPLRFSEGGEQAFGLPRASAAPVVLGDFVGDTRQGASVNCATVTLHPHGDGTHTETAAHVEHGAPLLCDLQPVVAGVAVVAMVRAERLGDVDESYSGEHEDNDAVLTLSSLQAALNTVSKLPSCVALVVGRVETDAANAYFTDEAMAAIADSRIQHVLCEEQSVDRLDDGGGLVNHRRYFRLAPRGEPQGGLDDKQRTVTEMVAPLHNVVDNGVYVMWLQLALPRWETDAAPSTPVLFPAIPAEVTTDD